MNLHNLTAVLSASLGLALMSSACAPQMSEAELAANQAIASLDAESRALLDDYGRFMTGRGRDKFLNAQSIVVRREIVRELRVSRMLGRFDAETRAAILRRELRKGMKISALLLSWGRPSYVEPYGAGDKPKELWVYDNLKLGDAPPRDFEVLLVKKRVAGLRADDELPLPRTRGSLVEHHLGRGTNYLKSERYDLAEQEYLVARDLDPGAPLPFRALGSLYAAWGKPDLAAEAYARYVEVAPDAPDSAQVRAIVRAWQKRASR